MSDFKNHAEFSSAPGGIETRDFIDPNQYVISSRLEINQILHALKRDVVLVTAAFGDEEKFLTSVVAVNERANYLMLERGRQAMQNDRILNAENLVCSTHLDRITIRFECTGIEAATCNGQMAFKTALPRELFRLQRREYYRMSTPLHPPVKCAIFATRDLKPAPLEVNVIDISCGGLGVVTPPAVFTPKLGDYYGCTIDLPGTGTVGGQVQVRNAFKVTLPDRTVTQRSGLAFTKLPETMLATIQRYNMTLERMTSRFHR